MNDVIEGFHSLQGTVDLNVKGAKTLSLSLVADVHSIYILVLMIEIVGVTLLTLNIFFSR